MLLRPSEPDIPPFQKKYTDLCPDDILPFFERQRSEFKQFIEGLDEAQLNYSYSHGKWTLRELIIHIIDTEQIFNYRALAVHRGEKQQLPGFDQDAYIEGAAFSHISTAALAGMFDSLRKFSILFYSHVKDEDWNKKGTMSGYEMSLRGFPFMIAGHLAYHQQIIEDRYLKQS